MKRHAIALLLGLNGALALGLAALWIGPDGQVQHIHWTAPEPVKTDYTQMLVPLPERSRVDTSRFLVLLERPLFAQTRRPPPPPPPPAPPPPVDTLRTARLLGVLESGPTGTVILNLDGRNRRVRLKEAIEGWTLQSIQGRSATFTNRGETRMLQLMRGNVSTYTGQPLAPPPAPPPPAPAANAPQAAAPAASAPPPAPAPAPAAGRRSRFSMGPG
ncbi:MAG: hypothetical protein PHI55_02395 [Burkholderiaceae bacterium]|nr:hypothetical protein [Burkholderiaceae bacterium]